MADMEKYRAVFNLFDDNNDGFINARELSDVSKKLGYALPKEKIQAIVAKLDDDSSGDIDFEEFYKAMVNIRGPSKNSTAATNGTNGTNGTPEQTPSPITDKKLDLEERRRRRRELRNQGIGSSGEDSSSVSNSLVGSSPTMSEEELSVASSRSVQESPPESPAPPSSDGDAPLPPPPSSDGDAPMSEEVNATTDDDNYSGGFSKVDYISKPVEEPIEAIPGIKVEAGFGASMQPGFEEDTQASKLPKPHELDEEIQQESLQLQASSPMHASDSLYDFGPAPYIEGAITPKSSTQDFSQPVPIEEDITPENSISAENAPIAFTTKPSEPKLDDKIIEDVAPTTAQDTSSEQPYSFQPIKPEDDTVNVVDSKPSDFGQEEIEPYVPDPDRPATPITYEDSGFSFGAMDPADFSPSNEPLPDCNLGYKPDPDRPPTPIESQDSGFSFSEMKPGDYEPVKRKPSVTQKTEPVKPIKEKKKKKEKRKPMSFSAFMKAFGSAIGFAAVVAVWLYLVFFL
ncbi:unnamed protein product [Owenia fusiformis]|uniref:Uncharacterized protein n=1 Tax=Owenia fusiformis TaxID=6347 RepID=A0A8J1U3A4_OWEFU|nr:unnamed protein product [Owenia fusiformis]